MKKYLIAFFILSVIGQLNGQTIDEILESAQAKSKAGDYKGAIAIMDKAEADGNADHRIYLNRAYYKEQIGDWEGVILDYDKGFPLTNFVFDSMLRARGKAKFKLGRYEEAMADFTEGIERPSKIWFFDNYYWRALCRLKLGDKEGACEDFAVTLTPGNWYDENNSKEVKIEMFRHCE